MVHLVSAYSTGFHIVYNHCLLKIQILKSINPLNTQLNPIRNFLALLGTHHILHVSSIRVNRCTKVTHWIKLFYFRISLDAYLLSTSEICTTQVETLPTLRKFKLPQLQALNIFKM